MNYLIFFLLAFASIVNTALFFIIRLNLDFLKNRIAILERQAEIHKLERWFSE